jgi:hypothetical protein
LNQWDPKPRRARATRVAQKGTPAEKGTVRAAVKMRFPGIGKRTTKT